MDVPPSTWQQLKARRERSSFSLRLVKFLPTQKTGSPCAVNEYHKTHMHFVSMILKIMVQLFIYIYHDGWRLSHNLFTIHRNDLICSWMSIWIVMIDSWWWEIIKFRWGHTPAGEARTFGHTKVLAILEKFSQVKSNNIKFSWHFFWFSSRLGPWRHIPRSMLMWMFNFDLGSTIKSVLKVQNCINYEMRIHTF